MSRIERTTSNGSTITLVSVSQGTSVLNELTTKLREDPNFYAELMGYPFGPRFPEF